MTDALIPALVLATLAGLTIPIGAALALLHTHVLPLWMETEARHSIIAFGAGALLAAVALVLLPEGLDRLSPGAALWWFAFGAIAFAVMDQQLATRGGQAAQFLAMMLDYLPEALALGALISGSYEAAVLVAMLIALQNLPESFNAMRELNTDSGRNSRRLLGLFVLMVPLGPLAAFAGLMLPNWADPHLGAVMMAASGGILYLMFQDIAPQIPLERSFAPPLGAIAGFALGLAGHIWI